VLRRKDAVSGRAAGNRIGRAAMPESSMTVVENLLRLHRRECDERRRYAVELELLAERLRADLARVHGEMAAIEDQASLDAGPLAERCRKLTVSVAELDVQIAAAQATLAAAEQQLKRHDRAVLDRAGGAALSDRRLARRIRQSRPAAPPQTVTPLRDG
jgi:hypothetical protein